MVLNPQLIRCSPYCSFTYSSAVGPRACDDRLETCSPPLRAFSKNLPGALPPSGLSVSCSPCQVGLALLVMASWCGLQLTFRLCQLLYLKNVNGKKGWVQWEFGGGWGGRAGNISEVIALNCTSSAERPWGRTCRLSRRHWGFLGMGRGARSSLALLLP